MRRQVLLRRGRVVLRVVLQRLPACLALRRCHEALAPGRGWNEEGEFWERTFLRLKWRG